MQTKDLGYSINQLHGFLNQMNGVLHIEDSLYQYKNADIKLISKPRDETNILKIERCIMELSGDENDINEFYRIFLINHMTMGG